MMMAAHDGVMVGFLWRGYDARCMRVHREPDQTRLSNQFTSSTSRVACIVAKLREGWRRTFWGVAQESHNANTTNTRHKDMRAHHGIYSRELTRTHSLRIIEGQILFLLGLLGSYSSVLLVLTAHVREWELTRLTGHFSDATLCFLYLCMLL